MKAAVPASDDSMAQGHSTTRWSEILAARTRDPERRQMHQNVVLGRYRRPLYEFLRRSGYSHEDAEDCLHGFVEKGILRGQLLDKASPEKGRFRTWLLRALEHYRISRWRAETARKRQPTGGFVSIDELDPASGSLPAGEPTAATVYRQEWARALLEEVIEILERQCRAAEMSKHWEVFRRTVLAPALSGTTAPPLADLCRELGIASTAEASNMNVTVKRRFQRVLRARLRQFVDSDEEVEDELRDLVATFASKTAGCECSLRMQW